jgi:hypothetical protein
MNIPPQVVWRIYHARDARTLARARLDHAEWICIGAGGTRRGACTNTAPEYDTFGR